jgi:hypothetical protein
MKYKFAIPTHRRSDIIGNLTLNTLKDFDKENIYLFISDDEDYKLYEELYPEYNLVLTNTKSVKEKFNFVQNYFSEGEWVVVLEDDVKEVQDLYERHLSNVLWYIFNFCGKHKIEAWGIYPSSNLFFMKKDIEVGLTYLVANMFGFISKKTENLNCILETKNDYERSILFHKVYGRVARFNFLSCKTNNYKTKGGMQTEKQQRSDMEFVASNKLVEMYPNIFSINEGRKSEYTELKMNKSVVKIKLPD